MGNILRPVRSPAPIAARGFTLVELAVVVAIVALLLGALLAPLATQYSLRKNKEGERAMSNIKEVLLGFAVSHNGRLPCPDSDIDGVEDFAGVAGPPDGCLQPEGYLPWQTLGILPTDPWGRLYRYQVSQPFAYEVLTGQPPDTTATQLDLNNLGTLTVRTRADDKSEIDMTTSAVAVVWSAGANGRAGRFFGVTTPPPNPPTGTGTDEETNYSTTILLTTYMLRIQTPPTSTCSDTVASQQYCEFDDLVTWIAAPELFNRLVQAGLLP